MAKTLLEVFSRLTGHGVPKGNIYSTLEVSEILGLDRSRVLRLAKKRHVGQPPNAARRFWLFSEDDIEEMRERKTGRPRKS